MAAEKPAESTQGLEYRNESGQIKNFNGRVFRGFSIQGMRDEKEVDGVRKQAFQEGLAQGRVEGKQQIASSLSALQHAIEELRQVKGQLIRESEKDVLQLVFSVARRIVGEELKIQPEHVVANVRRALALIGEIKSVVVLLNPADCAAVDKGIKEAAFKPEQMAGITIQPDAGISAGGCRVVAQNAEIDGQIETLLKNVCENCGVETAPAKDTK